ncbi:MAG: RNA polymerase sigma factor [Myxococcales bacterium]|nr:RNA polymerase sigma factor [Myxococcales bacterium]
MSDGFANAKKNIKKAEERKLIEKSLKGDEQSFAVLYKRYHGQVHAFCSRMLRGRFDVEDAVQQVFLEAWRSLNRFEGRSLFSTWLTKIAIHTCLSFHRKMGRVVLHSSDEIDPLENGVDIMWSQSPSVPENEILLGERKTTVNKLLSRMTPKKKQVFVMSDMQGMTAPEIGAILKIPDATVRTRLFHARREFSSWVERNKNYKDILA